MDPEKSSFPNKKTLYFQSDGVNEIIFVFVTLTRGDLEKNFDKNRSLVIETAQFTLLSEFSELFLEALPGVDGEFKLSMSR